MSEKTPTIGLLVELDNPAQTQPTLRYQLERIIGPMAANKVAQLDQESANIRDHLYRHYAERAVMAAFWRSKEFDTRVARFMSNLPAIEELALQAAGPWQPGEGDSCS